jgi:sugar/nucleoside kinase (ribokinase family)
MARIILLGEALVDYLCIEDDALLDKFDIIRKKPNQKSMDEIGRIITASEVIAECAGGCVTNTAVGLNELSTNADLVYCVGNDSRGRFYNDAISGLAHIKTYPEFVDLNTGVVMTFFTEEDDNGAMRTNVFNHGCADDLVLNGYLRQRLDANSIVYISCFSFCTPDVSNLLELLQYFGSSSSQMLVDGGGIADLEKATLEAILKSSSGLFLNALERSSLESCFGLPVEKISLGPWIVVKNGAGPTELYSGGKKQYEIDCVASECYVNGLGAGDAFSAGFLSEYSRTSNMREAICRGNQYAKHVVERIGSH